MVTRQMQREVEFMMFNEFVKKSRSSGDLTKNLRAFRSSSSLQIRSCRAFSESMLVAFIMLADPFAAKGSGVRLLCGYTTLQLKNHEK
jgi:hypothetical protein